MRTIVYTCDPYYWLLPGFFRQWQWYGGDSHGPTTVVGFGEIPEKIRTNMNGWNKFLSLGDFRDYPKERWSDGLIQYLQQEPEELVAIYLEDYWLMRDMNHLMVEEAVEYMHQNPDVIRFDLGTDRLYAKNVRDIGAIGYMDIIEAKGEYSFSFQASIWRRELLLEMLRPGESPWQSELNGTARLNAAPYRVVGSRQCLVRYMIVVNKGQFDREGKWMFPQRTLAAEDWKELDRLGYTTRG